MNEAKIGDRKLGFIEIGRGRLGLEMQAAFEQASISARDLHGEVNIKLTINVSPPDPEDPNFGKVSYAIRVVEPPKKSAKFTTLLKDGLIINEGSDQAAAIQYEMALSLPEKV